MSVSRIAELEARVARLEAILFRRKATRNGRRGYVDIPQAKSDQRWNLWIEYQHLKTLEVCNRIFSRRKGDHLPTSLAFFAETVRDADGCRFNLRELQRWFSRRNTFAHASRQDARIRRAIQSEIDRMCRSGYHIGMSQVEIERIHATVN